ncbi:MAG: InlB B-repeat-containing protein [Lachnospiraceae bacterium]|nr:InlB B-repeat-containing protein [Lachnospiraceae bacterium]
MKELLQSMTKRKQFLTSLSIFVLMFGMVAVVCANTTVKATSSQVVLTKSTGEVTLTDGQILTGSGGANTHVSIEDGATVTFSNVDITSIDEENSWAGITCKGDATIILADSTINNVIGHFIFPGIFVPENKTLKIDGKGSLYAKSAGWAAGIGAMCDELPCGNIIICGGKITAEGCSESAGIGGSGAGSCGDIEIRGGDVTAIGGSSGGAGIGSSGAEQSDCGNIIISGGKVNAKGGYGAAGIGTGYIGYCEDITISGGEVKAYGGSSTNMGGAGIGAGSGSNGQCACRNITISDAVVYAVGTTYCAGIGSGYQSTCGKINIKSGRVNATGGEKAPAIGAGVGRGASYWSRCGDIIMEAGTVEAEKGEGSSSTIGQSGTSSSCGKVKIGSWVGEVKESPYMLTLGATYTIRFEANGGSGSMPDQTVNCNLKSPIDANSFTRSGYCFVGWSSTSDGMVEYTNEQKVTDLVEKDTTKTLYAKWMSTTGIPEGVQIDAEYLDSQVGFYYMTMPESGTRSVNIDSTSYYPVKIYDDGGKNGNCSEYDKTLTFTCPQGKIINLSGYVLGSAGDTLTYVDVYDGSDTSATNLGQTKPATRYFSVKSSGNSLTIRFTVSKSVEGLNLTASIETPYYVKFNANGGEGTMDTRRYIYGEAGNILPENQFTKDGYVFAGWNTLPNGNGTFYKDKASVADLRVEENGVFELYAQWKRSLDSEGITVKPISPITYTGRKCNPVVTICDGTADISNLCSFSYSDNINAGKARVVISPKEDNTKYFGQITREFDIEKATPVITPPSPKRNLVYTGKTQKLINGGVTDFGEITYSLDGVNYGTTIPDVSNAGDYTVYYKVEENDNWNAVEPQTIAVNIEKAELQIKEKPQCTGITYGDALKKSTLSGGKANLEGTDIDGDFSWKDEEVVPEVTDVGKTECDAVFSPIDSQNFKECYFKLDVPVSKVQSRLTKAPEPIKTLVYTGKSQALVDAGVANGGTLEYSDSEDGIYSETIPNGTEAGNYKVWYKVVGDKNHFNINPASVSVVIKNAENVNNAPSEEMEVPYKNQKLEDITLPQGWEWSSSDKNVTLDVDVPYLTKITYVGNDKNNYNNTSMNITVIRKACEHNYDSVKYTWSEDGKKCSAIAVCSNDATHIIAEDAVVSAKVKADSTTVKNGTTTYTATFKNSLFTTQTKDVDDIPIKKENANDTMPTNIIREDTEVVVTSKNGEELGKVVITSKIGEEPAANYIGTTGNTVKKVVIPATITYNGITYKITRISDNAFKDNKTIESVIIGENIESIGKKAFAGCTSLQTLTIPSKVKKIGESAFSGTKKLKTLIVKSKNLKKKYVRNALKGSKIKTIKVKVGNKKINKQYVKKYKKIFAKKNAGIKVKVK